MGGSMQKEMGASEHEDVNQHAKKERVPAEGGMGVMGGMGSDGRHEEWWAAWKVMGSLSVTYIILCLIYISISMSYLYLRLILYLIYILCLIDICKKKISKSG